jgi:glycosyltransferase involved in cell wall biosynthesis
VRHSQPRLAMISAVNPYPTDAGKKIVLAGLIDYFVARLGVERIHYLLIGSNHVEHFPLQLRSISAPTATRAIRNVATRSAIGRSSMQESFLWSPKTHSAIQRFLGEASPSIELYDTVRTAQYASNGLGPTRICYLDDLFSERYTSMLSAARADRSIKFRPLGNFAERVPTKLHFLTENRISQKALLAAESSLVAKSEDHAARSFDRCLLINHDETRLLRTRAAVPDRKVATIPPLIIKAPTTVDREYRSSRQFLFLGLLSLPHNHDGLRSFICETWPRVLRRMPDARLRVVGREPQPELRTAISKYGFGAITLEGYVPDLDAMMAQSAALINPLRFGSGVKLKVIESLSRALPVVSTVIGASGILSGGEHGIYLADSTDEWVDRLEQLTSPKQNRDASAAASAHFSRIYSRNAVFAAYDAVFGLG